MGAVPGISFLASWVKGSVGAQNGVETGLAEHVRGQQMFRRLITLVEQRLAMAVSPSGSLPPLPLPEMTHERC